MLNAPKQTALRLVARGEIRMTGETYYRKSGMLTETVQQPHYRYLRREGYIIPGAKTIDGWRVQLTEKGETGCHWAE